MPLAGEDVKGIGIGVAGADTVLGGTGGGGGSVVIAEGFLVSNMGDMAG
jgi:hypothetical protein